jgi:predicted SnoaL-like aldol condensation-catalyzing enzyme
MATDPALETDDRAALSTREVAERFIEVFYNQNRLVDAFRAWVHPDYIKHDSNSATGRDGTIDALAAHMARHPEMTHEIKRVIHGGHGMVVVHYHFRRSPDDRGAAVVDIFRIEQGYLVEHWDVIQPLPDPATARNDNGMF